VLTSIQQLGTIAIYQAGATAGTISLAIYPSGAYTTATLVAAAQTANVKAGRYVYDLELVNSNTLTVERVVEGIITVYPEATK
jgi:hypothetical protein